MSNNLYRLKTEQSREFFSIINNERSTKKEILIKLGKWVEDKGTYMVKQYERMINFEKQLYKTFEDFQSDLKHSVGANKLIKQLYEEHKNLQTTWKQTCRRKNQLIRLASIEIRQELKLQLNSWCLPKPTKKQSSLVPKKITSLPVQTTLVPDNGDRENRTAMLIQALDFLGGMAGEDLDKIRRGNNPPPKITTTTLVPDNSDRENRTAMLIQALDFIGGMAGEDLDKIRRGG
ncbi:hypothetical protein M3Y97_00668500 [Aphelenchoides bicaudatus]|nr:hypothetical protein M3Y97_00668500 [Aphelenchoides bicaudatus]